MSFSGPVSFGGNPETGAPWFTVDVNSVAFTLFGREVKWYGLLIGLGLVLAIIYAFCRCKKFGVDPDKMTDVVLLGTVGGILGARVYYVIFAWDQYKGRSFLDMINITEGGLAIYGGIIGGLGIGYLACKWRRVKPLPMLDLASLGFLIGQGIGRWGNFMNQEAFGTNTSLPWGMYSLGTNSYLTSLKNQGIDVDPTMPVHPCFLYESLWCLLGFVLLHIFSKKFKKYDGQIFLLYLLWYGVGRFFIEGIRTDSLMFGPYRISRFLAGACVIAAAILLIVFRKRRKIFGEEGLRLQTAVEAEFRAAKLAAKQEKKTVKSSGKVEKEVSVSPLTEGEEPQNSMAEEEKEELAAHTAQTTQTTQEKDESSKEESQEEASDGEDD